MKKLATPFLWLAIGALGAIAVVALVYFNSMQILNGDGTPHDVSGLSNALVVFKKDLGFYPPSKIKLIETGAYDMENLLDRRSVEYLKRLWPRIKLEGLDWNGNGQIDDGEDILEGDQCLVYFLNGIGGMGFSTDHENPTKRGGERRGPYYSFPPARMLPNGNPSSKRGYLSFRDRYESNFFAFFSSGGKANGYQFDADDSDCRTIGAWPYVKELKPIPKFYQPDSFQLLCAGRDGKFGKGFVLPDGPVWSEETAADFYPAGSAGSDDLSNFSGDLLGR